jgi:DNA-binding protein H-NS
LVAKKSYSDVVEQIRQLQAEAESLKREEIEGVIARIREAIAVYELTPDDIFGKGRSLQAAKRGRAAKGAGRSSAKRGAAGVQYGDGQGNTWGGRGPRPRWLRDAFAKGASLESFRLGETGQAPVASDRADAGAAPKGTRRGRKGAGMNGPTGSAAKKAPRAATKRSVASKGRRGGKRAQSESPALSEVPAAAGSEQQ